jgi:hypothetical protein
VSFEGLQAGRTPPERTLYEWRLGVCSGVCSCSSPNSVLENLDSNVGLFRNAGVQGVSEAPKIVGGGKDATSKTVRGRRLVCVPRAEGSLPTHRILRNLDSNVGLFRNARRRLWHSSDRAGEDRQFEPAMRRRLVHLVWCCSCSHPTSKPGTATLTI